MASVTLPRRAHNLHLLRGHRNSQSYDINNEETNDIIKHNYQHISNRSEKPKTTRTSSCDEPESQSSTTNNNRIRHLCSRLKRHFSLTKEHRTPSEEHHENTSERRTNRFKNYQSFSTSSADESHSDIDWPDFEKVYESIPPCLINALPGLDDFSVPENSELSSDSFHFQIDETIECSIEQMNLFLQCKRGKSFRRNAICQKLDKIQYNGQLDVFVRQLMIEKLMRTWT